MRTMMVMIRMMMMAMMMTKENRLFVCGVHCYLSANSASAKVLEDGLGLLADTVLKDDAEDDLSVDPLGNARQRQH